MYECVLVVGTKEGRQWSILIVRVLGYPGSGRWASRSMLVSGASD